MQTYIIAKAFQPNPHYSTQRKKTLANFASSSIDTPIIQLIQSLNTLEYCFTLQSCYGHFVYEGQNDPNNIAPLTNYASDSIIDYRIAYIAFCIQNSDSGRKLYHDLSLIPQIDSEYIQFGSADWFWQRNVNSYVLQVEPERFKHQDRVTVNIDEALHIEKVKVTMFESLKDICGDKGIKG